MSNSVEKFPGKGVHTSGWTGRTLQDRRSTPCRSFEACSPAEKREHLRRHRPRGVSVSKGCELMGHSRSTFYDAAAAVLDSGELLARIGAICDEFECYGYRRVGAALRHRGVVVNARSCAVWWLR